MGRENWPLALVLGGGLGSGSAPARQSALLITSVTASATPFTTLVSPANLLAIDRELKFLP